MANRDSGFGVREAGLGAVGWGSCWEYRCSLRWPCRVSLGSNAMKAILKR